MESIKDIISKFVPEFGNQNHIMISQLIKKIGVLNKKKQTKPVKDEIESIINRINFLMKK